MSSQIHDGDLIFLVLDFKRRWLRKVESGKDYHTDKGFFKYDEIIGKDFGTTATLQPSQKKIALLKPLPSDIVMHMKRESQIIYPEDIGLILTYGDIHPGSIIMEAGVGSGTVTSIMAMFAQKEGHIYTHDVRPIAMKQAQQNLDKMGVSLYCTITLKDICQEELAIPDVDFIMLDLATPWLAIPKVISKLKANGNICSFSPTFEQIKKANKVLTEAGVQNLVTLELIKRTWQIKPNATRPDTRMIGHTGYLTFGTRSPQNFGFKQYSDYYSPENIGFVLVYSGIRPGANILLVSDHAEILTATLKRYLGQNSPIIAVKSSDFPTDITTETCQPIVQKIKDQAKTIQIDAFDTILFDKMCNERMIDVLDPLLKFSGVICVMSRLIEHAKEFYLTMQRMKYYDTKCYELMLRQVNVQPDITQAESFITPHSGYITIGRKVFESPESESEEKTEEEFIEPLEIAPDFNKDTGKAEKKIDWANLSPEEQKKFENQK